jgi:hypothetical protein
VRNSNLHNPWIVGNTLVDWLYFIPKRDGKAMDGGGRINTTLEGGPWFKVAPLNITDIMLALGQCMKGIGRRAQL